MPATRLLIRVGALAGTVLSLGVALIWVALWATRVDSPAEAQGLQAGMLLLSWIASLPTSLLVMRWAESPAYPVRTIILLGPVVNAVLLGGVLGLAADLLDRSKR